MKKLSVVFPNGVEEDHVHIVVKTPVTCVICLLLLTFLIYSQYHSHCVTAIAILLSLWMLLPVIIYSPVHLINQSFTISYIVLPPFATTATRQPDILAELHNFFKWKPPVLELTPTASQSKASHKLLMSLLIRYTHIPFYFRFSFAFSTSSIHHYAPLLRCNHTTIALASSDRSHLFDGHMTYDSHVFTSILSISNVPPPAVQPITSSHTAWSGTFNNFALSSHSCLPFVFNLPVFTCWKDHHY